MTLKGAINPLFLFIFISHQWSHFGVIITITGTEIKNKYNISKTNS